MEGNARLALAAAAGGDPGRASDPAVWDPLEALDCLAAITRYRRAEEIYGPDDRAEYWYRVVVGMVRKCAVRADGRRQIVDFLLPGDFFGLIVRHEHQFAAEAVTDGTVVARYPRRRVEMLADSDPRIGRRIREGAFEAISRSQARMLIVGRMSAVEKVGAFLVEMAQRSRSGAPEGGAPAERRDPARGHAPGEDPRLRHSRAGGRGAERAVREVFRRALAIGAPVRAQPGLAARG